MKTRQNLRPSLRLAMAFGLCVLAAGCGERDIGLRDVRNAADGPEEFGIVPNRPLEIPSDLAALPEPTLGGSNRSDQRPEADAIAALGGNPARIQSGRGIPTSDAALVAHTQRFGRNDGIRETLAAEDLEFRRRKSLFTFKIVPEDEYNQAYRRLTLEPFSEVERFRRSGVRTPAAPPKSALQ